jgi:two-component sensor histidine kinase
MVSFGDYLLRLINELAAEYAMSDRVQTEIRTADMALDVEQAIPLALIANELAANALEHAFPAGTHGRICVALSYASEPDEYGVLEVSDDGVPLPATFDLKTAESTGLYLVRTLASQLRAQLTVEESTPGKTFRLRFPLAN